MRKFIILLILLSSCNPYNWQPVFERDSYNHESVLKSYRNVLSATIVQAPGRLPYVVIQHESGTVIIQDSVILEKSRRIVERRQTWKH